MNSKKNKNTEPATEPTNDGVVKVIETTEIAGVTVSVPMYRATVGDRVQLFGDRVKANDWYREQRAYAKTWVGDNLINTFKERMDKLGENKIPPWKMDAAVNVYNAIETYLKIENP